MAAQVWRPGHAATMDSTNMQDFGYPSTHSMNAITNPWYAFLYLRAAGSLAGDITVSSPLGGVGAPLLSCPRAWAAAALCATWTSSPIWPYIVALCQFIFHAWKITRITTFRDAVV